MMSLPDFEFSNRPAAAPARTASRPRPRPKLVLAVSLTLNVILLVRLATMGGDESPAAQPAAESPATRPGDVPATPPPPARPVAALTAPSLTTAPEPVEADPATVPPTPLDRSDWRVVHASVTHSIPRTLAEPAAPDGDAVAAAYARLFMWDMDLRRDLRQGDEVALAYRWEGQDLVVGAASLDSDRYGTTFRAYRFHATGDSFPSYWDADGSEVPRRLVDGPLADYEQITSLLRDRPDHRGIDFKTPVGTEVRSPWAGVVTRTNWNTTYNGGCIEVRYDDGMTAKFLHLSDVLVDAGEAVRPGTLLGRTGNTGRTTAPHLHYQLERGDRTLDPLDVHGSIRRRLDAADLDRFRAEVAQLDALLAD